MLNKLEPPARAMAAKHFDDFIGDPRTDAGDRQSYVELNWRSHAKHLSNSIRALIGMEPIIGGPHTNKQLHARYWLQSLLEDE